MIRIIWYLFSGILILTGFIGFTYFRKYKGEVIPYPGLFLVASILLMGIGILLIYTRFRRTVTSVHKEFLAWKEKLKLNGEKIKVEFANCEVKDNFYYENMRKEVSDAQTAFTLAVMGHAPNENPDIQSRHSAVIVYKYQNPRTGELQTFMSPVIQKDKISLTVLLDMQQHTLIYVDRSNPKEYFFDLDFLQS